MNPAPVAVIDIGSNSIKVLVAARARDGGLDTLHTRTIDARISAGLSRSRPRLAEEGMARGLEAIRALLADAASFAASPCVLVATSAVRDAANGGEFRARVQHATGHPIRILSGDEEANFIGRGLTCDPTLRHLRDFYLFDLGGGSLECLAFHDRCVRQALSLQLGCVRLTEMFIADPSRPFSSDASGQVTEYVRAEFLRVGFSFSLPPGSVAVGTGGTISTARAVLGGREQKAFDATSPVVAVTSLQDLAAWLGAMDLSTRRSVAGLPPGRADVFPTALATLIAIASAGSFASFHHSLFNLRYGVADETLAASARA